VRIVKETGKPLAQVTRISGSIRGHWATGWPRTAKPVGTATPR
jgi:hypothetical protein